jgi:hypothetical protein
VRAALLLALSLTGCVGAWAYRPPPSHAPGTVHAFARRTLDGELFVMLTIRNEDDLPVEIAPDAVAIDAIDRAGNATPVELWAPDEYLAFLGRWHNDRQAVEGIIGPDDPRSFGREYSASPFDAFDDRERDRRNELQQREQAFAETASELATDLLWPGMLGPEQSISGWVVTKPAKGSALLVLVTLDGAEHRIELLADRDAGPFIPRLP